MRQQEKNERPEDLPRDGGGLHLEHPFAKQASADGSMADAARAQARGQAPPGGGAHYFELAGGSHPRPCRRLISGVRGVRRAVPAARKSLYFAVGRTSDRTAMAARASSGTWLP